MKTRRLLCLAVFIGFTLSARAESRTWTSSDGRTLEGELIAKTETTATLRRADKTTVVVPLGMLSAEDRAVVASAKLRDVAAELAQLVKAMPMPAGSNNDLKQLGDKYARMVGMIRATTIPANLKMIRSAIESDLKILEPISRTKPLSYDEKGRPIRSDAAGSGITSAIASVKWLNQQLTPYLAKIEALAP